MTRREWIAAALAQQAVPAAQARFVGVTVMPEYIQNEGIDGVLGNLIGRARATAVATSPYVMEPASQSTGSREPPIDAGAGSVRLLDRPLWGKRELFVRTAPSFAPNERLYRGLRYAPAPADALTWRQGGVVRDFLKEAKRRGLKTYLQVQAAIPPGYRVQFGGPLEDDQPRLPDGRIPANRVSKNASLASEEILQYHCALLKDLAQAYPEVDGIRVDWPEYPPYSLDDAFLDFSRPAEAAARKCGIPFERMRSDAMRFYRLLHGGLSESVLRRRESWSPAAWLVEYPGLTDLLHFKALLVEELLRRFREALPADKELMPNAFPPPLNIISGMHFARASAFSSAISVKLYTMHWPMILRFWGEQIKKANPDVAETALMEALEHWLEMNGPGGARRLEEYRYPEPEEPHPVLDDVMANKIRTARAASGKPVIALAHGYGPEADFRRRLAVAYRAAEGKVWVNRYGYLNDRKLEIIGDVCR